MSSRKTQRIKTKRPLVFSLEDDHMPTVRAVLHSGKCLGSEVNQPEFKSHTHHSGNPSMSLGLCFCCKMRTMGASTSQVCCENKSYRHYDFLFKVLLDSLGRTRHSVLRGPPVPGDFPGSLKCTLHTANVLFICDKSIFPTS